MSENNVTPEEVVVTLGERGQENMKSLNNRLILEVYKKGEHRAKVENGFARLEQKVAIKGLVVLMDSKLSDGTIVVAGSIAYIREASLHTKAWAQSHFSCDKISVPFIIAEISEVEFIASPGQI